jgi:hypothetical protein
MLVKYLNKFFITSVCAVSLMSCDKLKNFGDTNVNPNGLTDPNTAFLLTNAEAGLPQIDFTAGYYCQYFTDPSYPNNAQYAFTTSGLGDYNAGLMDLQNIINYNTDPVKKGASSVLSNGANQNQVAICRILKAYKYWQITDALGDIPYTQALKGQEGIFSPVYDRQEVVYKDMFKELREAADQFDNNTQVPAMKGDIIYSGDRDKWKKFANSLRLLMAVRLSKKYPNPTDFPALEAADAVAHPAGLIEDNADNFTLSYPGGVYSNPLSVQNQSGVSKTFTDLMTGMSDARMNAFGAQAFLGAASNSPSSLGIPFGVNNVDGNAFVAANTTWARILLGTHRQTNSPFVMISAANVLLARAEAAEREWVFGYTPEDDYVSGILRSFEQWGVPFTSPNNAAYETGTGVAQIGVNVYNSIDPSSSATTTSKLERIHLQQYIAWYPLGFRGWCEWRRTGIPKLQPTRFNLNSNNGIPRRYAYSQAQYNTNRTNVLDAVSKLPGGEDTQENRVWWDQ